MGIVHDFDKQLEFSQSSEHEVWLVEAYKRKFPTMIGQLAVKGNNPAGKSFGIDRYIHLANGKVLTLDEKIRDRCYGDILLEFIRNDVTGAPGWIEKPDLQVDYIVYAISPTKQLYLLPLPQLQVAWTNHKAEWLKSYRTIKAANQTYNTLSLAVPFEVVYRAVVEALGYQLKGEE